MLGRFLDAIPRIGTGLVVTASIVVSFLLTQPDVVLTPTVKVALGAANVALVYWARRSDPTAANDAG